MLEPVGCAFPSQIYMLSFLTWPVSNLTNREESKASSTGYFSSLLNCFSNCLAVLEALLGRWRRTGSLQSLPQRSLESCGASLFWFWQSWFVGVDGWGIFQSLHSQIQENSEQGNPSNAGSCWSLGDAIMFLRLVGMSTRQQLWAFREPDPQGHEGLAWPGGVPENHLQGTHECPQLT